MVKDGTVRIDGCCGIIEDARPIVWSDRTRAPTRTPPSSSQAVPEPVTQLPL